MKFAKGCARKTGFKNTGRGRRLFAQLLLVAKPFWVSDKRRKAYLLLFTVVALLCTVVAVNVWAASVAGKFATALQARDQAQYGYCLLLYFAVILLVTPITVTYGYFRSRLALEWRQWLSSSLVARYFSHRAYYKLSHDPQIDNPDERISQDVDSFCNITVGLSVALVDALVTVATFLGVLWTISPALAGVAIAYSFAGCVITTLIGKRLVHLNAEHLRLEADLRYSIARVRGDVESIAFYRGEARVSAQILRCLRSAVSNVGATMMLNRNLGFFTSSYTLLVSLIPAAVIAPLYFKGSLAFGEITRGSLAFGQVFTGLTLFITQFNALSAYAAIIERLASLMTKLDECAAPPPAASPAVELVEGDHFKFERLAITTPDGSRTLIDDLTFSLPQGESLLIIGPSGAGKSSLLRAVAGLWTIGSGRIVRPPLEQVMFLPQQPHMPTCTLREAVCYPRAADAAATGAILGILRLVNLDHIPGRVGGLDTEQHWRDILSLGEQQRLSFARLMLAGPRFAVLDEATSALDNHNQRLLYGLLAQLNATVVSVGHRDSINQYHNFTLELKGDGGWELYRRAPRQRLEAHSEGETHFVPIPRARVLPAAEKKRA